MTTTDTALAEWWAAERARTDQIEQHTRLVVTARWCLVALTTGAVVAFWRVSR